MARKTRKQFFRSARKHRFSCNCGPCRCHRSHTSLKQMQSQALKGT